MHVCVHVYMHACMCTCLYACMHVYVCMYVHIHVFMLGEGHHEPLEHWRIKPISHGNFEVKPLRVITTSSLVTFLKHLNFWCTLSLYMSELVIFNQPSRNVWDCSKAYRWHVAYLRWLKVFTL
jgi:hypothetical protein